MSSEATGPSAESSKTPPETVSSLEAIPGDSASVADVPAEKTRDLLRGGKLSVRDRLGERLLRRVGGRMWDRPNLAVSRKLYDRFGIDDPWAPPGTKKRDSGLGLGPVNLRFGEQRRQPAPHLKPKAPKKKKLPGQDHDPVAKYRRPKPTPKPVSEAKRPAPKPSAPPKPAQSGPTGKYAIPTGSSGEFGGTKKQPLRGKLPQRPELAAKGAAPSKGAPTRRSPSSPSQGSRRQASRPPAAPPARTAPQHAPLKQRTPPSKSRPAAGRSAAPTRRSSGGGGGFKPPVVGPARKGAKKRRAGRFRMAPTEVRSPVVREVPVTPPPAPTPDLTSPSPTASGAPAAAEAPPKKKKAPPKPVDRSIPTGPMGLDDIFGGALEGGRMRFGRKRKKKDDDDADG